METVKRAIKSRAQREAEQEARRAVIGDFWKKKDKPVPGHVAEWKDNRMERDRKLRIIEQSIVNGTLDIDELLSKYDLAKYL